MLILCHAFCIIDLLKRCIKMLIIEEIQIITVVLVSKLEKLAHVLCM